MSDNFLEPSDDTPVNIQSPEESMPGLAGHIRSKFEDAENGRRVHGYKHIKTSEEFMIQRLSIETLSVLKFL